MSAAPRDVASRIGEISTGCCGGVGQRLDERVVVGHAAVDAQRRDRDPAVGLRGVDEVGAAVRDAFEHGPHHLRRGRFRGSSPKSAAARAVVPRGCAEAEQRGHVHDATGVGATPRRSRPTRPRSR